MMHGQQNIKFWNIDVLNASRSYVAPGIYKICNNKKKHKGGS